MFFRTDILKNLFYKRLEFYYDGFSMSEVFKKYKILLWQIVSDVHFIKEQNFIMTRYMYLLHICMMDKHKLG